MNRKLFIVLTASAALLVLALISFRPGYNAELPRLHLRDGGEFRVIQVTYTARPSDSTDHNLDAQKVRWRLYRLLPAPLRQRIPEPSRGIGYQSSDHPVLSIWWAHIDPATHKPELGEAGDVLITDDSGQQKNLGWPDPAKDHRQIFVTDPPTKSKRLTFQFPIWGEPVRFSIDNPAYCP